MVVPVRLVSRLTDDIERDAAARTVAAAIGLHRHINASRGRRAQLLASVPPRGRLSGCPPEGETLELGLGLLLDRGFVAARGGRRGALLRAASAVSRTKALFEEQLGVRLVVRSLHLNEGGGGDFASTGPNEAPAGGSGTRCAAYQPTVMRGSGVPVIFEGAAVALSEFTRWVSGHAEPPPAVGVWQLLTDCFPGNGTTGLASVRSACSAARPLRFVDSGEPPSDSGDQQCLRVEGSGNCAISMSAGGACVESGACQGATGVTSDGRHFWRTFAHEVAHTLGAVHTFARGGLMAYSDERSFVTAQLPPTEAPWAPICACGPRNCPRGPHDGRVH